MIVDKIERIEFMEKSIGSIFKPVFWSPEIVNTISTFKNLVKDDLIIQISDILDPDYKYTHEAILSNVNTHGLFQFTLNLEESVSSKHKEEDMIASYSSYLEDRILSSFENLQTHEAIVVAIDLFTLLYCFIAVSTIRYSFKKILLDGLLKIISCYNHYNGVDSLSIELSKLQKEILIREEWIHGN